MRKSDKTRCGIYIRTSTAKQRTDGQERDLRAYAKQRGWAVAVVWCDSAVSSRQRDRVGFLSAREAVRRGEVDVVLCWAFDRLARSVRELVDFADHLEAHHVDFVSMTQGFDTTTDAGRLVFHVLAAVGQMERSIIRERVKMGLRAARERGSLLGRPRVDVDMSLLRRLREQGMSVEKCAGALGVGVGTVVRRLAD